MQADDEPRSDFVSIVIADNTRIHTQLLTEAMRCDRSLLVVASAPGSRELLQATSRVPIDVAVISYALDEQPGRGLEVLRQMRSHRPGIKGVILLDSCRPQEVLDCFRAGARGVFSKQDQLENLCKCIRCVYEGQIWARSMDLDVALEALSSSPIVSLTDHKGMELLSRRERQVIQCLASGMTNRDIAKTLGLSPHTIKNYLFRIYDKVGASSRTELLYLTMKHGPCTAEDPEYDESTKLSTLLKAAEAGLPGAQLHLAEHYRQGNGSSDPVSAYMWFLVCEESLRSVRNQVEGGKAALAQNMSPKQVGEAERRAAEWFKERRKEPASSVIEIGEGRRKSVAVSHS